MKKKTEDENKMKASTSHSCLSHFFLWRPHCLHPGEKQVHFLTERLQLLMRRVSLDKNIHDSNELHRLPAKHSHVFLLA